MAIRRGSEVTVRGGGGLEEVEREVVGGDDNILEVDPVSQSERQREGY